VKARPASRSGSGRTDTSAISTIHLPEGNGSVRSRRGLFTDLHRRHRPSGARCAAGRLWPGAALLVGYDAKASRPAHALRGTKITQCQ